MNKVWLTIVIMAVVTYATRSFAFVIWGNKQKSSSIIEYFGHVLPYSMMGLLVIYSFKNVSINQSPFGLSELFSSLVCVILHLWKRNNLISIFGSTLVYMFIIQVFL